MGLVSGVVDDPEKVAEEIASNDPDALRELKALLRTDGDRETTDEREAGAFGRLLDE
jgi:enoyl-CoA hydratase/carnithine racemase